MIIYLDYDGTVTEHAYPSIGRCNFGCIEVIRRIQDSGHDVILNTMRVEFRDNSLQKALEWFEKAWMLVKDRSQRDTFELKPITHTKYKIHPWPWDLDEAIKHNQLYIDDIATGIPLKPCCMISGNMVDWDEVERQLVLKGIIK